MMESTLYRIPHPTITVESDDPRGRPTTRRMTTQEMLNAGMRQVATLGGDPIIHGAPGQPIPEGATVYIKGRSRWKWDELAARAPAIAPLVMRAHVRLESTGERGEVGRSSRLETMAESERRNHADIEAVNLPPHQWWGDE